MNSWARRIAAAAAVIAANMFLFSCSMGPQPVQKGTPAFYWSAAKQTYAAGDYIKTLEHLDNIVATQNEFTAKARTWQLVLASGMAKGYIDVAEYFDSGARINKADPLPFSKESTQARGSAGRLALRFAESFGIFQKGNEDPVVLAFAFPIGNPAPVALLKTIGNGILPQRPEIDTAQKAAIERAVLLAACAAAGSPDDAAKAQEAFKAAEPKVERPIFLLAMANALYQEAQLYTRNKMDDPEKLKVFCERAREALKAVPETEETRALDAKIQKTLKGTGKAAGTQRVL